MNVDQLNEALEVPVELGITAGEDRYVSISFIPATLKFKVIYEDEIGRYDMFFSRADEALAEYNKKCNR